jgi:tetratricopeptide (TPR) repeat protein
MTLNNMGRDYSLLGEADKALDFDIRALAIWREVKDRRGEALALMTIGWAFSALEQPEKALASTIAALSLAKAAGDPGIEGGIETTLMFGFRKQHRPDAAIFFGMEAVNSYQRIRKNISGLDKDLQSGFAQSKSGTYRVLAELLVQAGRLGEAEQILDLLKEQELKDIVRGADTGAKFEPLKFTTSQQQVHNQLPTLEKMARAIAELCIDYAVLQAKAAHTPEEDARLETLLASIEQQKKEIQVFLTNTIFPELEQKPSAEQAENSARSYLQNTLAALGPRVIGIRLLLGEEHAYAIVVTANTRKKFELKATTAELRDKAFESLKTLRARVRSQATVGAVICHGRSPFGG